MTCGNDVDAGDQSPLACLSRPKGPEMIDFPFGASVLAHKLIGERRNNIFLIVVRRKQ